jgi:hypothetical protein
MGRLGFTGDTSVTDTTVTDITATDITAMVFATRVTAYPGSGMAAPVTSDDQSGIAATGADLPEQDMDAPALGNAHPVP